MKTQPNSVLVVVESPFGAYDAERFDLERLTHMLDVLVVDITPLVQPEYWDLYKSRAIHHPAVIVAETWPQVVSVLRSRTWDGWIDELGVSTVARRIRKTLREKGCARIRIRLGLLPGDFIIQSSTKARLSARRSQLGFLGVLRNLVMYVPRRLVRRVPPPDVVLGSGSFTERDVPAGSSIIWAHSFDYEKSLIEREENVERSSHAAVFLDQNLGFHPDQLHSGINAPVDVGGYYPAMRAAFDRVEALIGGAVTIAVHPKSTIGNLEPFFGNRLALREGAQTVVGATELVLCHASASLSYAVIWRKPVLFLTSDDLSISWYKSHIDEMSRILDRPVLNIDHLEDVAAEQLRKMLERPVDETCYATYEERFIRSRWSRSGRLWQVFADGFDEFLTTRR